MSADVLGGELVHVEELEAGDVVCFEHPKTVDGSIVWETVTEPIREIFVEPGRIGYRRVELQTRFMRRHPFDLIWRCGS